MDSLTQIVLGAACGEAVAGRKLGNRAMLWGAIGGTIPDLDVFASFFTDEMSATAFHRGFMHSFMFAVLAPWLFAWLASWFYHGGVYRKRGYKAAAMVVWILFYLLAAVGINFIPLMVGEGLNWWVLTPTLILGVWLVGNLWTHYWRPDLNLVEAPYRTWVWLFFWSIFTHPILDCFTNWGTQVWQPFADTRIQWTTVSVVDPLYTLPFALLLIIASRLHRSSRTRFWLNWAGIFWGCSYLAYTYLHKIAVNTAFEQTLQAQHITYKRYLTAPSIFNNIVWYGVAEGDSAYYYSMFGFNDHPPAFSGISVLPKNRELLQELPSDSRAAYFLTWFSNGYYNAIPYHGDTIQVNDLRFGLAGDALTADNNYIFSFLVYKNAAGEWEAVQNRRQQQDTGKFVASMGQLWKRVKGER